MDSRSIPAISLSISDGAGATRTAGDGQLHRPGGFTRIVESVGGVEGARDAGAFTAARPQEKKRDLNVSVRAPRNAALEL